MRLDKVLGCLLGVTLVSASWAQGAIRNQTLCGWYENPTPANFYLTDKSGQWVIGLQGGHQAEGDLPEFKDSQWKAYDSSRGYGYGCACIQGRVNTSTREVLEINKSQVKAIAACRQDKSLPAMH